MSSPVPPEAQAGSAKAGSFFQRFGKAIVRAITWPARLSVAGKVAFVLAIFLALLAVTVWLVIRNDPKHVELYHVLTWQRIVTVVALLIVIPIVVYYGLRLWLEGERSLFPDIDYAWDAGVEALRDNGLSLQSLPLFLILGSPNETQNASFAAASGRAFRVHAVPEGPAPIQWYANPDGIFLFLNSVGALGALTGKIEARDLSLVAEPFVSDFSDLPETSPPPQAPRDVAPSTAGSSRGTLTLDQPVRLAALEPELAGSSGGSPAGAATAGARAGSPQSELRGTMMFPTSPAAPVETEPPPAAPVPARAASPSVFRRSPAVETSAGLSAKETDTQRRRVFYLAQRIARAREPLCPLNGVLTVLPFSSVAASSSEAQALERAVRSDLTVIQRTTRLRCPVTTLIGGMEQEAGFSELVRRVGRDRAAAQRFGRGFDVRGRASEDELNAFSTHVVGAFEDWVYSLFRESDALSHTGNPLLYELLCKVRSTLKGRLSHVLRKGYGVDPQRHAADDAFLFSGCYFAATGPTDDQQAFVRGVFDKLEEEQESIEWTAAGVLADRRRRRFAAAGICAAAALAISLAALLALR